MINLHYLNRYNKLISHYKTNFVEGYNETHHILPKCLGGSDEIENLVLLPSRAHFICHYLLHKAYPSDNRLALAFSMMTVNNSYQKRSSKLYEKAKLTRSAALKNVPRPEWVKEKLRKPKLNKENYKKPKSEEHRKNIGKALKGRNNYWQHKVIESEGFKAYQAKRKETAQKNKEWHRKNFLQLQVTRKVYYLLFPEISEVTLKRYLRGL